MAQYGSKEYWDDRYTRDPDTFDWYQRWVSLKDLFMGYCAEYKTEPFLVVGSGNSKLSEDMYDDGFTDILSVDFSPVVTKLMNERCGDQLGLRFQEKDVCKLSEEFLEGRFKVIIDKGCLDAVLCSEAVHAQKMLEEVSNVLAVNGHYICVSHGQPSFRLHFLQRPKHKWDIEIHTLPKPMKGAVPTPADEKEHVHFVYVCTKVESSEVPHHSSDLSALATSSGAWA